VTGGRGSKVAVFSVTYFTDGPCGQVKLIGSLGS